MTAVAFLGLGRMGTPMAANLARAGHRLAVWNRSADKAIAFADEHRAHVSGTPALAAAGADVVITMLADDGALRSAYDRPGSDGLLDGLRPGTACIDMSTVAPATVTELAERAGRRGARFYDAPVSGSVAAATAASLTIMLGGLGSRAAAGVAARAAHEPDASGGPAEVASDALVLDVLSAIGSPIIPVGPTGSGAAMKLAVNSIVHALNGAVSEALVLAERAGIDRRLAYDVLENSAVAAPFVKYRRTSFIEPDIAPVAFLLRLAAKDLRLALDLAARVKADMPQTGANLAVLDRAAAEGYAELDETALAGYLRDP